MALETEQTYRGKRHRIGNRHRVGNKHRVGICLATSSGPGSAVLYVGILSRTTDVWGAQQKVRGTEVSEMDCDIGLTRARAALIGSAVR